MHLGRRRLSNGKDNVVRVHVRDDVKLAILKFEAVFFRLQHFFAETATCFERNTEELLNNKPYTEYGIRFVRSRNTRARLTMIIFIIFTSAHIGGFNTIAHDLVQKTIAI